LQTWVDPVADLVRADPHASEADEHRFVVMNTFSIGSRLGFRRVFDRPPSLGRFGRDFLAALRC
jgi:hypothetical protein